MADELQLQLFACLPNALMVLDRELRYVTANPAYLALTGARLEDLVGRHVFDAFPDDPSDPNSASVAMLRSSFARVLATGEPDELAALVYHVPRARGGPLEARIWSARHTPVRGASGCVELIIQETADVTELHGDAGSSLTGIDVVQRAMRSQEAAFTLDAQLRSLRQMFAQAPGFMCFLRGPDHVFEIVNAAYLQLVGHRDIVGMTVAAALPEVVGQGAITLLDTVFNTGEPYVGKGLLLQLQRTPGAPLEERYIDFVYQPIRDVSERILGIFVQGQDVTVQHRADAETRGLMVEAESARRELELAEAHVRFLIKNIPVQVWTALPDGRLDFVSDRVLAYFELAAADILGNGWLALLHPDDVELCAARWNEALATGAPYEMEFRLRRADGTYRWHLSRAAAQRADDGTTIRRWFGTNTDIHEARLAIAELRVRSEYEQRLIGIVSHDLRNPLGSIKLAAELLETRALDPVSARTVARLSRSADRATRLISDLLDFAKARIGTTIPISPRATNLREIVEHIVDELQLTAPTRTIRFDHTGYEDGHWDADRIAQVLSNLVGNALQHGPPSSPITVDSRVDQDRAMFAVTNEGPPIPPAELATLFEPFRRGTNARDSGGSLGLGLYIAREVVAAHGGRIEVASVQGQGTCFTVHLPRFAVPTTTGGGTRPTPSPSGPGT